MNKREQGVVIIVALFIVALVAVMSFVMMSRLERDTYRSTMLVRNVQAEFYAEGSIAWAKDQLRNNWLLQKQNRIVDIMPKKADEAIVNGYRINSTITDMQASFNINNLSDITERDKFLLLIKAVAPDLGDAKSKELVKAVVDWVTPSAQDNNYVKYYLKLPVPYRPAHRPMSNISELHLVKGMTPALYAALSPFLVALPVTTQINVQTAPPEVLMILGQNMTMDVAKALVQIRKGLPITSTQAFSDLELVKAQHLQDPKITVTSNFFLLKTEVSIEKQTLVLYTLLERVPSSGQAVVNILWQSKGIV